MPGLSAVPVRCFRKNCTSTRVAHSCTPLVSHANLKADGKLKIEIGSSESSNWDLICICRSEAHFATLQMTLWFLWDDLSGRQYHSNPLLPESVVNAADYLKPFFTIVRFFLGDQLTDQCPYWSLVPNRIWKFAYSPIACHPKTLFPGRNRIFLWGLWPGQVLAHVSAFRLLWRRFEQRIDDI